MLTPYVLDTHSKMIYKKLLGFEPFKNASNVFLYASLPTEVQTSYIASYCLKNNIPIAYPKIFPDKHQMLFYLVQGLDDLKTVTYGKITLYEPDEKSCPLIFPTSEDVMIVPAMAFDQNKNRLGYGGGYYDRYLQKYHPFTIGINFDFALLKSLPIESYDQPLNAIITESQLLL